MPTEKIIKVLVGLTPFFICVGLSVYLIIKYWNEGSHIEPKVKVQKTFLTWLKGLKTSLKRIIRRVGTIKPADE